MRGKFQLAGSFYEHGSHTENLIFLVAGQLHFQMHIFDGITFIFDITSKQLRHTFETIGYFLEPLALEAVV